MINKVICGDCLEVIRNIPDKSIDLVITDPPYSVSQKGKIINRNIKHYKWKNRNNISLDFGEWDRQWEDDKEYYKWIESWYIELVRILKSKAWLYIFFDKQKIGIFDLYLSKKYNIKSRTIFTWIKTNPIPSFRKVNWNSGTELIYVGSKGDSKLKNFLYQKYMNNYYISSNSSAWKKTKHPTEKSVNLLSRFILTSSNENDLILDPFLGSGTTAVACKQLGRKFIGIDIEQKYCDMANERLKQEYLL